MVKRVSIFFKVLHDSITCSDDFGNGISLNCPTNSIINIANANYGRTDPDTCPGPNENTNCLLDKIQILAFNCNGKQNCIYTPNFNEDPCFGTYKYLKVQYTCLNGKFVLY